eukprot:1002970-Pyramimonas_sp.AAC.1
MRSLTLRVSPVAILEPSQGPLGASAGADGASYKSLGALSRRHSDTVNVGPSPSQTALLDSVEPNRNRQRRDHK